MVFYFQKPQMGQSIMIILAHNAQQKQRFSYDYIKDNVDTIAYQITPRLSRIIPFFL